MNTCDLRTGWMTAASWRMDIQIIQTSKEIMGLRRKEGTQV
jgi:hypothetical protein